MNTYVETKKHMVSLTRDYLMLDGIYTSCVIITHIYVPEMYRQQGELSKLLSQLEQEQKTLAVHNVVNSILKYHLISRGYILDSTHQYMYKRK